MYDISEQANMLQARRQFLKTSGMGLGATVMGSLLPQNSAARVARANHVQPKAKRVIFLFMAGAPSQVDLFDYKRISQRDLKSRSLPASAWANASPP